MIIEKLKQKKERRKSQVDAHRKKASQAMIRKATKDRTT